MSRRSDVIDYIADKDNISKDEAKMQFAEYTPQVKKEMELEATMLHKQRIMKEIARRKRQEEMDKKYKEYIAKKNKP